MDIAVSENQWQRADTPALLLVARVEAMTAPAQMDALIAYIRSIKLLAPTSEAVKRIRSRDFSDFGHVPLWVPTSHQP
jgi:hypothetical protein